MQSGKNKFIKGIKIKSTLIIALVLSIIVCLSSALIIIYKNNNQQYTLINIIGRQRMLTQMIAKDANRKYVLMQTLNKGSLIESNEVILSKIDRINQSLNDANLEFEHSLFMLDKGVYQKDHMILEFKEFRKEKSELIKNSYDLWVEISKNLKILKNSTEVNKQSAEAILFINTNNERLLGYFDEITQALMQYMNQISLMDMYVLMILLIISLVSLFIALAQLQKYIIVPLNELYKGISGYVLYNEASKSKLLTKDDLKPIVSEIQEGFDKLNKLNTLIKNINQNMSFNEVLTYIYNTFSTFIPYSHIGIALLGDGGRTIEASFGISEVLKQLPKSLVGVKVKVNQTSLVEIIKTGKPRVINDLKSYVTDKPNKTYNQVILDAGIRSSITLPLRYQQQTIGIIFFSSITPNIYQEEHIQFLETLADSIAISLYQHIFIDELLYSSVLALAKMAESRDEDTGEHLERMRIYSEKIISFLRADQYYIDQLTMDFIKDILRFSPMHDIGKVGIRDGILLKPGNLTAEEYEEMKKHATYGADVLRIADKNIEKQGKSLFKMGVEIAEAHHERWDGTGYPYGRAGNQIPLSARIVAVADVFDALTSKRPYKEAYSFEKSFEIMVEGSGKHFDPIIIGSLVRHRDEFMTLYNDLKKIHHDYKLS